MLITVAVIGWLTLQPIPGQALTSDKTPWHCIACGSAGGADLLQNVILFLPLGMVLASRRIGVWNTVAIGAATSLGIEISQVLFLEGRDGALGDVIANSIGALSGYSVGINWRSLLLPRRPTSSLAGGILALFLMQLLASWWLNSADRSPGPSPFRFTTSPAAPGRPTYPHPASALQLFGTPIVPSDRQEISALPVRNGAEHDFSVRFPWQVPTTDALTPILRLDDAHRWPVLAIDRRGEQIGIELRTRAHRLRLRSMTVVLPVPQGAKEGDELTVRGATGSGAISVEMRSTSGSSVRRGRLGAQTGWALINPFTPTHDLGRQWLAWTLAWLIGWGVLLGWSAAQSAAPWLFGTGALSGLLLLTTLSATRASIVEILALAFAWSIAAFSSRRCHRSPDGA